LSHFHFEEASIRFKSSWKIEIFNRYPNKLISVGDKCRGKLPDFEYDIIYILTMHIFHVMEKQQLGF